MKIKTYRTNRRRKRWAKARRQSGCQGSEERGFMRLSVQSMNKGQQTEGYSRSKCWDITRIIGCRILSIIFRWIHRAIVIRKE